MRFEIKALQRQTGLTVLYITQDQSDALAISDRIVCYGYVRLHQADRNA